VGEPLQALRATAHALSERSPKPLLDVHHARGGAVVHAWNLEVVRPRVRQFTSVNALDAGRRRELGAPLGFPAIEEDGGGHHGEIGVDDRGGNRSRQGPQPEQAGLGQRLGQLVQRLEGNESQHTIRQGHWHRIQIPGHEPAFERVDQLDPLGAEPDSRPTPVCPRPAARPQPVHPIHPIPRRHHEEDSNRPRRYRPMDTVPGIDEQQDHQGGQGDGDQKEDQRRAES
jgi:hypothetical protein